MNLIRDGVLHRCCTICSEVIWAQNPSTTAVESDTSPARLWKVRTATGRDPPCCFTLHNVFFAPTSLHLLSASDTQGYRLWQSEVRFFFIKCSRRA